MQVLVFWKMLEKDVYKAQVSLALSSKKIEHVSSMLPDTFNLNRFILVDGDRTLLNAALLGIQGGLSAAGKLVGKHFLASEEIRQVVCQNSDCSKHHGSFLFIYNPDDEIKDKDEDGLPISH